MKAIYEILGLTPQRYEELVTDLFVNWAGKHCIRPTDYQHILANPAISKWFRSELSFIEEDLKEDISDYGSEKISPYKGEKIYAVGTERILNHYPKSLLEAAQPLKRGVTLTIQRGIPISYLKLN
ncbi:hypothetical protein GCM10007424_23400 [Flavobacterium suaedae]|uniref:Uncharacterized protein n=1 Tax=Flavobacterium suaedae TaxID=1767027 RepID=A0ABQ1JZB2_9FLAO|nr:hypothetical protein [Flavobacterium suaedae]GGB82686.1 hypothetical protein GCM10007424_23400 [Flavobacterium suaedae]